MDMCNNYKRTGKECPYKDSTGAVCAICIGNNGDIPHVNEVGL